MVCLGIKPRASGWKVQMNPLSYGGTLNILENLLNKIKIQKSRKCFLDKSKQNIWISTHAITVHRDGMSLLNITVSHYLSFD